MEEEKGHKNQNSMVQDPDKEEEGIFPMAR